MFNRKSLLLASTLFVSVASVAQADNYNYGYSASWMNQIGVTSAVETAAGGGSGYTVAIIDTGINANSLTVKGGVSTASKCVMTLYACTNGVTDDNGHGTAVASILAGSTNSGAIMAGVAPKATILSIKALNAAGNGSFTDVNTGIRTAADAGAKVINLSLTFSPDAATVAAINYATSKGAYVVYAGGNSGTNMFGNLNAGFSAASKNQLVFAGSVGANNVKNSWSNAPGAGYAGNWLMAPGESIVAPGLNNVNYYWSGTSMAAPVVSGAIALLANTWPILQTNGTAVKLLAATATDLGVKGVDSTYGQGLINVTAAFQPVGGLTVSAGGKTYSVTSLTPAMLTGGALGSLSAITSQLANYTAFDSYARNFSVNLSSMAAVKSSTTGAQVAASAATPTVKATSTRFADGSSLNMLSSESPSLNTRSIGVSGRDSEQTDNSWMMTWSQADGSVLSMGKGFSPAMGFASALWGSDNAAVQMSSQMDASNALMGFAQGGTFASYGMAVSADSRVAFSFTSTEVMKSSQGIGSGTDWATSKANAAGAGYVTKVNSFWKVGVTVGMLNEEAGLLGTNYDKNSLLSLGDSHQSMSIGTTHSFNLTDKTTLMVDGALVRVSGAQANGLVSDVSTLYARSYGVSLMSNDVFQENDSVTASIKKPLRIVSGTASVVTSGVDAGGNPVAGTTKVGLTPSGSQTDISLGYSVGFDNGGKLGAAATYSNDAQNIAGEKDFGGMVSYSLKF